MEVLMMQQLSSSLPKVKTSSQDVDIKKMDSIDLAIYIHNQGDGKLGYVDCPICNNKGDVAYRIDNYMAIKPCSCMNERKIMQRIQDSGLSGQFSQYRFDNFRTDEDWQKSIKNVTLDFMDHFNDSKPFKWLYLGGQVGSGKTHLISALMRELINKGYDIAYMQFSEEMPDIEKGLVSYGELNLKALSLYERFKTVEILVIDDAFKNYNKQRAFWDIINHRYKNGDLVTIISSQYNYNQLLQITGDESLPSRIFERCTQKYFKPIKFDDSRNQRTKGLSE